MKIEAADLEVSGVKKKNQKRSRKVRKEKSLSLCHPLKACQTDKADRLKVITEMAFPLRLLVQEQREYLEKRQHLRRLF